MKTIRLRPSKKKTGYMLAVAALLFLATLFIPGAFFITPFLMPLVICPLVCTVKHPVFFISISCTIPAAVACYAFPDDTLLSWVLLFVSAACPMVTLMLMKEQPPFELKHHRKYLAAYLLGVVALLVWLFYRAQPQPMIDFLAEKLSGKLRETSLGNQFVIRLAESGFISLPEGMKEIKNTFVVIDPEMLNELHLSFIAFAKKLLSRGIPDLIARVVLAGSLFTVLRGENYVGCFLITQENYRNKKKVIVVEPPGFSRLALPRKDIFILMGAYFVAGFLQLVSTGIFSSMMYLTSRFINHILTLAGAAAMIRIMAGKNESALDCAGIAAAFVWLFVPDVLWLLLVLEPYIMYHLLKDKEEQK